MDTAQTAEKRRFTRVPFDAAVEIQGTGGKWHGKLLDISLKGALVTRPQGWHQAPNDRVLLHIDAPHQAFEIRMEARVAHVEDGQVGFKCESIDIDSMSHLRRLVELNVGDEGVLHRELAALGNG